MSYCPDSKRCIRRKTRAMTIGSLELGSHMPIRIQSMTTTPTSDVAKTVEQIMQLADAGCEIVRVTVQGMKEAKACEHIKSQLIQKGYDVPLVADIHFFPPAAMTVVDFVDKVRINPGNYVDKRASFKTIDYSDDSYQREIERLEEKFAPLVLKCRDQNKAMRIGTNHGSLSDRIMNRFGDSPQGMLESALEYARVCRKYDYHNFLFSMKSSNTRVMIEAYRLLSQKMDELGWDYPLHLGVTEAGEGEDGRIKSSIGIGSLLLDGIGDTIRVSLTEDPCFELDPCRSLINLANTYQKPTSSLEFSENYRGQLSYQKRDSDLDSLSFLHQDGTVIVELNEKELLQEGIETKLGFSFKNGKWQAKDDVCEAVFVEAKQLSPEAHNKLYAIKAMGLEVLCTANLDFGIRVITKDNKHALKQSDFMGFSAPSGKKALLIEEVKEAKSLITTTNPDLILLGFKNQALHNSRAIFSLLKTMGRKLPVIFAFDYKDKNKEDLLIDAGAENGALFCDGLGDGVLIRSSYGPNAAKFISFSILQGSRKRTVKTEFISCPSCGRTLFDLQSVSKRIRDKTAHLPGVKIAIMGCIVNGPGEMADADFGYVGSKPDRVDLYVGKTCVQRDIEHLEADERLIELIKEHGKWVEPQSEEMEVSPKQELTAKTSC